MSQPMHFAGEAINFLQLCVIDIHSERAFNRRQVCAMCVRCDLHAAVNTTGAILPACRCTGIFSFQKARGSLAYATKSGKGSTRSTGEFSWEDFLSLSSKANTVTS